MSDPVTQYAQTQPVEEVTGADTVVVNQNVGPQGNAIEDFVELLPTIVKESKEGYKTTEFWLMIVISLLTVVDGIPLPEKYEAVVVAALGIAYALSRGLAKKGVAVVEPQKDEV